MRRRWRAFRELSANDRRFTILATLGLPFVQLGLEGLGAKRLIRWLERTLPPAGAPLGEEPELVAGARRAESLIGSVARGGLVRVTCLRQAIALWWLLRRRRIACEIKLGVRRADDKVLAHAWVESGPIRLGAMPDAGEPFEAFDAAFSDVA
ncbi:MAG TPA: lasso peptide biosynthesis B2 protein [Thermoanaerobaculia bacterium]|nr:lasso peptide biosynthesis B2 protein [Thermoanaerobaculia bacterium]